VIESQKGRWDQTTSVQVFRVSGSKLSQVVTVPVSFTNAGKADAPTTCEGAWSIAEASGHGTLVVVAKPGMGPTSAKQCAKAGTYEYTLTNGKFTKHTAAPTKK